MPVRINRSVKRFHNLHKGERCIILGNGPSLDMVDLERIDCPTIGLNASWLVHDSTYHCATDEWQFELYAKHRHINGWPNLFTADVDYGEAPTPKSCVRLNVLDHEGEAQWSDDLTEGVYICTTITWYALQLARWMGFDEIGLIGFDLRAATVWTPLPHEGNSKFSAHPKADAPFFEETADTQNRLMGWARRRLEGQARIVNLSPISRCDTLEREKFGQAFG